MLSHLVHRHGTKWREVVKSLPGRTADAARSRYDRLQREEDGKTTCAHVSAQHLSCAPQSLDLLPSTAPSSVSSCSPGNMSPESSEGTSAEPHERTSPESSRTSTVLPSERDIHPVVVAQPILAAPSSSALALQVAPHVPLPSPPCSPPSTVILRGGKLLRSLIRVAILVRTRQADLELGAQHASSEGSQSASLGKAFHRSADAKGNDEPGDTIGDNMERTTQVLLSPLAQAMAIASSLLVVVVSDLAKLPFFWMLMSAVLTVLLTLFVLGSRRAARTLCVCIAMDGVLRLVAVLYGLTTAPQQLYDEVQGFNRDIHDSRHTIGVFASLIGMLLAAQPAANIGLKLKLQVAALSGVLRLCITLLCNPSRRGEELLQHLRIIELPFLGTITLCLCLMRTCRLSGGRASEEHGG